MALSRLINSILFRCHPSLSMTFFEFFPCSECTRLLPCIGAGESGIAHGLLVAGAPDHPSGEEGFPIHPTTPLLWHIQGPSVNFDLPPSQILWNPLHQPKGLMANFLLGWHLALKTEPLPLISILALDALGGGGDPTAAKFGSYFY